MDLEDALREAAQLSHRLGKARFLADCTGLKGGHSAVDLFELIALFETAGVDHTMKEAILLPKLLARRGGRALP